MSETHGRVLNWKKGPKDERDFKSVRRLTAPVKLPVAFELDKQIPIFDQGNVGSCVGNGSCESYRFESAQLIGKFDFEPSRLFVYYNARKIQGWEKEDSGAYIRDGFKAMNKWGLAKEELWPYRDNLTSVIKTPTDIVYQDGLNNIIVKYATVQQTENSFKETLLSGAAICFGFTVYSSFMSGNWDTSTGVMPIPKKSERIEGGHCVIFIGYDDAKKCFLCQNSWGTGWGQKGKFWMPYSFALNPDMCDDFWCIETIKIAGEPVDPNPPTPPIEIDWKSVANILFKTSKELWAVKKPTIVRLGIALNLPCSEKMTFRQNYNLVKAKLGL